MKKKITYTDEPIELGATIKDFLPPPGELALRDKTVRVTLNLNEESVNFFKEEAQREGIPYQRLIRRELKKTSLLKRARYLDHLIF